MAKSLFALMPKFLAMIFRLAASGRVTAKPPENNFRIACRLKEQFWVLARNQILYLKNLKAPWQHNNVDLPVISDCLRLVIEWIGRSRDWEFSLVS
jgi:hypothetical protein